MPALGPGRRSTSSRSRARRASCCRSRPTRSPSPPSIRRAPPRWSRASASSPGPTRRGWPRAPRRNAREAPISIYECHLGSWMRVPEHGNRYLTYDELADRLVPYVKEMGFTHLELLPISEYPFDGSWGYQPIGLFAPTSRHGSPEAFARFVDRCHRAGIGLLLDWVPGHFPTDPHGLGYFDGTHLYEHADPRLGLPPRLEHADLQLRPARGRELPARQRAVLAQALPHRRPPGRRGRLDALPRLLAQAGRVDPQRVSAATRTSTRSHFLRRLNELAYGEAEGATTIAEESTAWPAVSRPTYLGGLGFGYKWNMGWMHDTLQLHQRGPGPSQVSPPRADLRPDLRLQRELHPAAQPRRGRARQGLAARQDAGRRLAEVRQPARLLRLHVRPSGQEAPVHGRRVRARGASGTTTRASTGTCSTIRSTRACSSSCAT